MSEGALHMAGAAMSRAPAHLSRDAKLHLTRAVTPSSPYTERVRMRWTSSLSSSPFNGGGGESLENSNGLGWVPVLPCRQRAFCSPACSLP
jgi:hypothetical protein